ncbi:tripartite tricarboxylate transporter substrate binding protein [Vineibacter terrae]|uniref:Tripartite tricarboxylate transporter substrate binding protein n=1 Tax=Vineibacter terrae TaxID=2586908 RepID=A0A5C8PPB2_9HYPH|nr:tripartite tricarboxylate transporter substrate binding protein [Vineibacter terrae]TXL75712.1 tripartite tricarboxylate transporter substrate binding protein [Vineibacter terrae]
MGRGMLALLIACVWTAGAAAQDYPSKPIRMIVPYPPGGATDILARNIQQSMGEILGQPIVIDNKAGAGGSIGTAQAARSAPDGYTLVFGNLGPNAINISLNPDIGYDPVRDFAPISLAATMPLFLVAHPNLPARNVAELIALAKAKPGSLTFASVGVGSASHVTGELFNSMVGVKIMHAPYKGGAPAINDLLAGHVSVMYASGIEATTYIQAGRMKLLAVSTAGRSSLFPNAPAISETVPGFDVGVWFGVLAPAGTPPAIVSRLNDAIGRALSRPDVQEKFRQLSTEPAATTPAAFAALIASEVARWGKVVKESGAKLE